MCPPVHPMSSRQHNRPCACTFTLLPNELAHRWRPAKSSRIVHALRRATIRWSGRFGGGAFCAFKARGNHPGASSHRLVIVSVSKAVPERIVSTPWNKWAAPLRIVIVVVAQIAKKRRKPTVLGMVQSYGDAQGPQPDLF